jgi:mRNA interferase ChpB
MDPTLGTEMQGMRPALVLSNSESNKQGRALVAPITQGATLIGFEVGQLR